MLTARDSGSKVAVMTLDLDAFRDVNDTLGHDYGDELLITVANGCERDHSYRRLGRSNAWRPVSHLHAGREHCKHHHTAQTSMRSDSEPYLLAGLRIEIAVSIGT